MFNLQNEILKKHHLKEINIIRDVFSMGLEINSILKMIEEELCLF